jgi:hypothetical protein
MSILILLFGINVCMESNKIKKKSPKVHWFRTREHQESTGPENFSTGPEYRNGGNKIC